MLVVLASSLGAVMAFMVLLWALSVRLGDASIVDIAWGVAFVLIGWVGFAVGDGARDRSLLLAVLITLWGVRLSAYLARRRAELPADSSTNTNRR